MNAVGNVKQSLTERVFGQLVVEILSSVYAAGDHLPPERTLAETFGVNRQVVREATKRLAQLGLVKITQGDGTRVLSFLDTAGLDLLALMATVPQATVAGATLFRSVLEMRSAVAVDLARLCAMRGTPELRARVLSTAVAMGEASSDEAIFDLDVALWDLIREGADNIAYRLMYNTLKQGALHIRAQILPWQLYEIRCADFRRPLARAILKGDDRLAEARARRDFRTAMQGLVPLLTGLPSAPTRAKPPIRHGRGG